MASSSRPRDGSSSNKELPNELAEQHLKSTEQRRGAEEEANRAIDESIVWWVREVGLKDGISGFLYRKPYDETVIDERFVVRQYIVKLALAGKLFMWWFVGPEGQALTDAVRFKGNPAPGTGTGPSKYLEDHHMEVKFAPLEYDLNYDNYLRKYLEAFGLPVS